MKQSPLYKALHPEHVPELVNILYDNELMEQEIIYLTPSQAGGQASTATDPGMSPGVHHTKKGVLTTSMSARPL